MNGSILEVIIIGAGHAGLSASYYLKHLGLEHAVFERGKIGESWRAQRWDSFIMNTANRLNILPGYIYKGKKPEGFSSATEFVKSLEDYVSSFQLPVSENTDVLSIEKLQSNPYFTLSVSQDNELVRTYNCWQVIVATGASNVPNVSTFASLVSSDITQLHSAQYRNAAQLPEGAVLVIGGAQSGCQITEDLLDAGRKVFLSTSRVPRIPRRYRGKDIMDWLIETKLMDFTNVGILPEMESKREPLLSGSGDELGHTLSLQLLAQKGAVLLGRMNNAIGETVFFDDNVGEHIEFGDDYTAKVKSMIDEFIRTNKIEASFQEVDEVEVPFVDPGESNLSLNLMDNNITSIVWATGFLGKYDFVKLPVLNERGQPVHHHGVSATEGLYFIDCSPHRDWKSNFIFGIKEDATFITSKIYSVLR